MHTPRDEFTKFNVVLGTHSRKYMKLYAARMQYEISFVIAYTLQPICCPLVATFTRYGTTRGKSFCRPTQEKDFALLSSTTI